MLWKGLDLGETILLKVTSYSRQVDSSSKSGLQKRKPQSVEDVEWSGRYAGLFIVRNDSSLNLIVDVVRIDLVYQNTGKPASVLAEHIHSHWLSDWQSVTQWQYFIFNGYPF